MSENKQPISVIALDAADYELAKRWSCENMLLEHNGPLETFSYTYEDPYTPEVWASVATGLHPTEHGVHGRNDEEWSSATLNFLSSSARYLPSSFRSRLGSALDQKVSSRSISITDQPHVFSSGKVYEWPGISESPHLIEAWDVIERAENGELSEEELFSDLIGDFGKKIGWLSAMKTTSTPIIGTHIHYLDIAGHVFAKREQSLKEMYQRANSLLDIIASNTSRLVIMSDHGMQTSFCGDDNPGEHSRRALISTNFDSDIPEDVFSIANWLEEITATERESRQASVDAPTDHLKDLGYMS